MSKFFEDCLEELGFVPHKNNSLHWSRYNEGWDYTVIVHINDRDYRRLKFSMFVAGMNTSSVKNLKVPTTKTEIKSILNLMGLSIINSSVNPNSLKGWGIPKSNHDNNGR